MQARDTDVTVKNGESILVAEENIELIDEETMAACEALIEREKTNCGQWKK